MVIRRSVIAASLVTLIAAAPARRAVAPDDIALVKTVADPQVDPKGEWVAYTVAETDVASDKGFSHLWMTSWDGRRTVQLTSRPKESESSPRWSRDGRWLAFISSRGDENEEDQLWLLDRMGGEARQSVRIMSELRRFVGMAGRVSKRVPNPFNPLLVRELSMEMINGNVTIPSLIDLVLAPRRMRMLRSPNHRYSS